MFAIRDLSWAFALHALVLLGLLFAQTWQHEAIKPLPERTIQVNMVSLQTLQAMMPKPKAETKPEVEVKPAPVVIPPIAKPITKANIKPAVKKPVAKAKKPVKVAVKAKATVKQVVKASQIEEEPDYDPFAPLQSTKKHKAKPKVSGKETLDAMLSKQLSDEELAQYVAGMQKAVERKWKVSTEMLDRVQEALVELELFRNGQVKAVRILQSSGSAVLDASLQQAVYAAAPFQIPEQQFELFKVNRIRFFPLM